MNTYTAVILPTRSSDFVTRRIEANSLREAKGIFANTRHESVVILEGKFASTEEAVLCACANEGDGS